MDKEEFNVYGLLAVLELLTTSKTYLDEYIVKYPENETDALSYSVDPQCKCRENLIKHFNSNAKDVGDFTKEFIVNNSTELNWAEFIKRYETHSAPGTIVKIDKTPEAYRNLINQMQTERWAFRHMSVTVEDDKYAIFFA